MLWRRFCIAPILITSKRGFQKRYVWVCAAVQINCNADSQVHSSDASRRLFRSFERFNPFPIGSICSFSSSSCSPQSIRPQFAPRHIYTSIRLWYLIVIDHLCQCYISNFLFVGKSSRAVALARMGLRIVVVRLNESPDSLLNMTLNALRRVRDHLRKNCASSVVQHQTCLNVLRCLIFTVSEVANEVYKAHVKGPHSLREAPEVFVVRYFFGTNAASYIEPRFNAKVSSLLVSPSSMDESVLSNQLSDPKTIVFIDEVIGCFWPFMFRCFCVSFIKVHMTCRCFLWKTSSSEYSQTSMRTTIWCLEKAIRLLSSWKSIPKAPPTASIWPTFEIFSTRKRTTVNHQVEPSLSGRLIHRTWKIFWHHLACPHSQRHQLRIQM